MKTFKSFKEKDEIFFHKKIDNINTLITELKNFEPVTIYHPYFKKDVVKKNLFRGMTNATFRLYSSIQRCLDYRQNKGIKLSLTTLEREIIYRFHGNDKIQDAFKLEVSDSAHPSILAQWAFIQHFGGPSHFIDFTPNIENAFFFAIPTKEIELQYNNDENDLNNYISIYIYPDNIFEYGNLNELYHHGSVSGRNTYLRTLKEHPEFQIDVNDVRKEMFEQPLDPQFWGASIYGSEIFKISDILTGEEDLCRSFQFSYFTTEWKFLLWKHMSYDTLGIGTKIETSLSH